jgi:hypothetical protein
MLRVIPRKSFLFVLKMREARGKSKGGGTLASLLVFGVKVGPPLPELLRGFLS